MTRRFFLFQILPPEADISTGATNTFFCLRREYLVQEEDLRVAQAAASRR